MHYFRHHLSGSSFTIDLAAVMTNMWTRSPVVRHNQVRRYGSGETEFEVSPPGNVSSVGKVRFGPVLSQLSLNAEPDPQFGSGSFPER
jgi:hypothetical protein